MTAAAILDSKTIAMSLLFDQLLPYLVEMWRLLLKTRV